MFFTDRSFVNSGNPELSEIFYNWGCAVYKKINKALQTVHLLFEIIKNNKIVSSASAENVGCNQSEVVHRIVCVVTQGSEPTEVEFELSQTYYVYNVLTS